jgi:hypothetical protein
VGGFDAFTDNRGHGNAPNAAPALLAAKKLRDDRQTERLPLSSDTE